MTAVRQVLAALIALAMAFFAMLGIATAGASVTGAGNGHIYAYDNSPHRAGPTFTTMERGPPATRDDATIYDADGLWSLGAAVRTDGVADQPILNYDHPAPLVRIAHVASMPAGAADDGSSARADLSRSSVAANAGVCCTNLTCRISFPMSAGAAAGWL